MNEQRQEMLRENRQRKMQQEYKNIAKECRIQTCRVSLNAYNKEKIKKTIFYFRISISE